MPSTTRSNSRVAAHESASGWAARKAGLKAQSTGRLRSPLRVDGCVQPYHRGAEATGKRDGRADQIDGLAALPVRRQSATRASAASARGPDITGTISNAKASSLLSEPNPRCFFAPGTALSVVQATWTTDKPGLSATQVKKFGGRFSASPSPISA